MSKLKTVASKKQIRLQLDVLRQSLQSVLKNSKSISLILPSGQRLFNEISHDIELDYRCEIPSLDSEAVETATTYIRNSRIDDFMLLLFDGIIVTGRSHRNYLSSLESANKSNLKVKLVSIASKVSLTDNFREEDTLSAFKFDQEHVSGFGFGEHRHLDYLVSKID